MSDNNGETKDIIALLRGVRQVRQFGAAPVPQEAIDDIMEVARWTGSGMNVQPWEFVLVHNPATLKALATGADSNAHVARANAAIVIAMHGEGKEIMAYDEGRLSERILVAAAAHGVDGGIWWFKDGGANAKSLLGIPEDRHVRTAISLGLPADQPAPPNSNGGRKPISELVHEEKF